MSKVGKYNFYDTIISTHGHFRRGSYVLMLGCRISESHMITSYQILELVSIRDLFIQDSKIPQCFFPILKEINVIATNPKKEQAQVRKLQDSRLTPIIDFDLSALKTSTS